MAEIPFTHKADFFTAVFAKAEYTSDMHEYKPPCSLQMTRHSPRADAQHCLCSADTSAREQRSLHEQTVFYLGHTALITLLITLSTCAYQQVTCWRAWCALVVNESQHACKSMMLHLSALTAASLTTGVSYISNTSELRAMSRSSVV